MKKKPFLLLLPVCLAFCLHLASCDDEGKPVPDLWEQIRNTAWTMDKIVKDNETGEDCVQNNTIGFYAPNNGPYPGSHGYNTDGSISDGGNTTQKEEPSAPTILALVSPGVKAVSSSPNNYVVTPYAVVRTFFYDKAPSWSEAGTYFFDTIDMQINKTGNKISDAVPIEYYDENNKIHYLTRSFHISVSGDKMKISSVKWWDIWGAERLTGTYSKISSDPKYAFNEGKTKVWEQIRNTAWTKQGNSKPSVGFYEKNNGPSSNSSYGNDYVYLETSDGSVSIRSGISESGDGFSLMGPDTGHSTGPYSYYSYVPFKIAVSNNGNTLTISVKRQEWIPSTWKSDSFSDDDNYNYNSDSGKRYTVEELGAYFNGTYTKTLNYNWDEDRAKLWEQIRNTAWTKNGDSKPSVGFYESDKGPANYSEASWEDGYVYFRPTTDSYYGRSFSLHIDKNKGYSLSINKKGDKINTTSSVFFNIAVSNNGNTLTISNIGQGWYENTYEDGHSERWPYSGYDDEKLGTLNGTYTKTSSDPSYSWDYYYY